MKCLLLNKIKLQGIAKRLLMTALERSAVRQNKTYEELEKIVEGQENRRQWHDDIGVIVFFFEKKKMRHMLRREKIRVFCHRNSGKLNSDSEFEDQEFRDIFATAGSSGAS